MLLTLCRYRKTTALLFYIIFYGELLASASHVKAAAIVGYSNGFAKNFSMNATAHELRDLNIPGNEVAPDWKEKETPPRQKFSTAKNKEAFFGPGPTQPEMQAFTSANANNMVDLFTGDFSYNIPLMDVGGYPVNISYRSGISMDQEASWVGLGWNINPGTITRNLRGLPDDFDGADSVKKVSWVKENKTIGVTGGANVEITGLPIGLGASLGVFYNNYKGWGLENSVNASIDAGIGAGGHLSGGLSINNNSQEGLTIAPSFTVRFSQKDGDDKYVNGSFSTSLPYNSRYGIKGLQLSAGIGQTYRKSMNITDDEGNVVGQKNVNGSTSTGFSSVIAFASPTAMPSITMPFTSRQYSFTGKLGLEATVVHPNFFISGYVSKQQIDPQDTLLSLPAYGYLYSQDGNKTKNPLQDYNREKEMIYRDNPPIPNIAVPFYTYDAFSISGEGTGGMFRAYRGDIGYVHDHLIRSKDGSTGGSVDVGIGDLVHAGVDVNISQSFTQNSAWLDQNTMRNMLDFRYSDTSFEASYFRNPGEKSINSKSFYDALGGDDVVTVGLYQPGISSSTIQATNYLVRYRNKKPVGSSLITPQNATKPARDKRAQVISYLNATEADAVGLSKYIENYTPNQFGMSNCFSNLTISNGANGLQAFYFPNNTLAGSSYNQIDDSIYYDWVKNAPKVSGNPSFPADNFSVRWVGRIKAPVTGQYTFATTRDDGVRLWLNDSLVINKWSSHAAIVDSVHLNLVAGQMYKIKLEFVEYKGYAVAKLQWSYPGQSLKPVAAPFYYLPQEDVVTVNSNLKLEQRITSYRKPNHISEIDVLNPDGRKYVYGIPVYNFRQKEATFSVNGLVNGNLSTGLVKFQNGIDNTTRNPNGQDHYLNSEEIPAYAHSFLLTGIVSPDYVDLTGNGISDDDLGDAIKFKYSKINGIDNPYKWRAPYVKDSVSLNEGLKTDSRDDRGSYTYGEKELWYLHSIESKTMIATFVTENRTDMMAIDEQGRKYNDNSAKRLKEIDLYSKADFMINGTNAKPIKTVHFDYSYELCQGVNSPVLADSGKLTLKRIWFTYNGNNGKLRQNPYVFSYNAKNPRYNLKSYDRWGNYKDPLQNPGSTVSNVITNSEYPYALQDSTMAAQNAGAWALDSIYLPSGGSMKIIYESDDYGYVQNKRAMSLFKILGLGSAPGLTTTSPVLYKGATDNLYIYVSVPSAVSTKQDVFNKYLTDVKKLYFKLFVQMPTDIYGKGSEYVSCYADLDTLNGYGTVAGKPNTIWIKVNGIDLKADGPGPYSPLTKAAIQYLRLNLPSKAYPGSQVGDNLDLAAAVKMIFSLADNITTAFTNFDNTARTKVWAQQIDTSRSYVRLNSPLYQKFGGGYRVKQVTIYDNWNKMTGQRTALYGQTYTYKTIKNILGTDQLISSGVASWEPGIGGEENPFRLPIEYTEETSVLGPVSMGYTEEPLGESLFPSPLVGYSKVRVRTINYKNIRSANGYQETGFYTAYDFPVITDRTLIDGNTKKRFKPSVANFLRINAKYYLAISQGFKVELNDMHGKMRSQGYYPENDPNNPVTYTENFYRVENQAAEQKKLSNVVMAMKQDGTIDSAALIGKDVELYVDMREQQSVTSGNNISVNTDMFALPFIPPFFVIPSFFSLGQRQENKFRSVGTTKVIQRYGIIDSVIHIDKGSRISTQDLVYDAETGDVLLNRTQNEFNDPVYSFTYPAYWAYDAMGPAYKNIGVVANHLSISKGKINSGLSVPPQDIFSAGDELLVTGKQFTGTTGSCTPFATFAGETKVWAFDSAVTGTGTSSLYLLDALGNPYTGNDVSVKVVRSGRRNMAGSVGSVTTLVNPLRINGSGQYQIYLDTATHVVTAAASEFKNIWKVESRNAQRRLVQINCPVTPYCYDTIPANYQATPLVTCFSPTPYILYSYYGAFVYSAFNPSSTNVNIPDTTGFWINLGSTTTGRLNQTGLWACGGCPSGCSPVNTWIGFNKTVYNPTSDTVFIGLGADNQARVTIDQKDTIQMLDPLQGGNPYYRWHIFPYYLPRGNHNIKVEGYNFSGPATFGAEIYNISRSLLMAADSNTIKAHTLFSTTYEANIRDSFPTGYSCPLDYRLDSTGGHYNCIKAVPCKCDTVVSLSCYNAITDTTINPYFTDILGNWRNYKAYTYYANRSETDPTAAINVRTNGTIANFAAFWKFQNGKITPNYDTSRWVWNTQTTIFNKKGFELENKDPLGRYNAGIYGYNFTMPVAVVQNAQYRESAFEGFEDYAYTTQGCDTTCPSGRHLDFSAYAWKITTTQKHTGKNSLQLNAGEQASVNVKIGTLASDTVSGALSVSKINDACFSSQQVVGGVRANSNLVHPLFSPFAGKQMLISAWIKESQDCSCNTYVNNQIQIVMAGSSPSTLTFTPSGPIIEGWQRYESLFTVPAGDTSFTISMKATGSVSAYFDDLRIEPFNANMKSFVYHPVNLRLMAELDENNYATFYEYDNDGTLIRVKKETEKGIQTIKETRSALFKQ